MMTLRHRVDQTIPRCLKRCVYYVCKVVPVPRSPKLQVLNRVNIPILQKANNGLIYFKVKVSNMTENVRESRERKKIIKG